MAEDPTAQLAAYRRTIDNLDSALVHLLAERFKCTQQVGELKARWQLPPADPAREAQQVERLRVLALDAGLDPAFAEKFLSFVIREVLRHHEAIAGRGEGRGDHIHRSANPAADERVPRGWRGPVRGGVGCRGGAERRSGAGAMRRG